MQKNGWTIDVKHHNTNSNFTFTESCGMETFHGFRGANTISYSFEECGRGILKFGNCYGAFEVSVYLNEEKLGQADGNAKKEVYFDYSENDTLTILTDAGIIKLISLRLESNCRDTVYS